MAAPNSQNLVHNLLLFGRLLRGLGMDVNPGRMIDLVHAFEQINIGKKADFYFAARSLLVHRHEDIPLFDEAFELFWRTPTEEWTTMDLRAMGERRRFRKPTFTPPPLKEPKADSAQQNGSRPVEPDEPPIVQATLTYSEREVLRHKDFSELTAEELQEIQQLMSGLVWQLGMRPARRMRSGQGAQFDMRRTIRNSLRFGGEILLWERRQRKVKPRPLVIIADISGSMERYTRLLLHFIYILSEGLHQKVEAFVFSTRLTRITRQLRERDVDQALMLVSRQVPDWSGGTRIGEALKTFNFMWGRRVLGQGAVALLISDGWDRGDVDLLKKEIARLQRSCYRLIWLNPLLGSDEYEPLTRGMQAALPFVDDFLPVHNLASLEDLAEHLSHIDDHRPFRRQMA
ncbi:MAG: VWA domain-containing protein [Anaerolineales bacterium]